MRKKILVIEDNQQNLHRFHEFLDRNGYEVYETDNDLEARTIALNCKPGLIIINISRISLSLIASLVALRQNPDTCCIPIIGYTKRETLMELKRMVGFCLNALLAKPFHLRKLGTLIDQHFPKGLAISKCNHATN